MEESLQGVPVVRDDGVGGKVTAVTANGDGSPIAVVRFDDGAQVAVPPQMITPTKTASIGSNWPLLASHRRTTWSSPWWRKKS